MREYAKLSCLAARLQVVTLKNETQQAFMFLSPSDDPDSGNTLKDFRRFAYSEDGNEEMKEHSMLLTRVALGDKRESLDTLLDDMTPETIADYARTTSKAWLDLTEQAV